MTSKAEGLRDCEDLEAIDHEIARLRAQNAALLEALKPLVAGETLPHQQYEAEYVGYSNILKLGLDQACEQAHKAHVQAARAAIAQAEGERE